MTRSRNIFDPKSKEPYKLSRSRLDRFLKCPHWGFYLDRRLGVDQISGHAFTLNSATDTLLKKEFDVCRAKKKRKLRIVSVSKAFYGKTHDKKIYEETRTVSLPNAKRIGDAAYLGTAVRIPKKKPKGKELKPRWKKGNRNLSSKRVVVEHGIGKMKIWRMCRDTYRNKRSKHTIMFKNIAGLHNMMYA